MTVAAQFAYGGDPNKYLDAYNGQFVPGNFSLSAVPELSTWSMLIAGFAGIGLFRFGGRRLSKPISLTA